MKCCPKLNNVRKLSGAEMELHADMKTANYIINAAKNPLMSYFLKEEQAVLITYSNIMVTMITYSVSCILSKVFLVPQIESS